MEEFFESIPLLIAVAQKQDIGTTLSDISALKGLVAKIKANGPQAIAALDQVSLLSDVKAVQRTINLAAGLLEDKSHGAQAVSLLKKVLAA